MHMNTNITQVSNITRMKNDTTILVFIYPNKAVILCFIDDIVDDNIQDEEEVDHGELEDEFDEELFTNSDLEYQSYLKHQSNNLSNLFSYF